MKLLLSPHSLRLPLRSLRLKILFFCETDMYTGFAEKKEVTRGRTASQNNSCL
jgi:hypothetical protein